MLFEQFLQRRGIERRIVLSTPHHLSLPAIVEKTDLLAKPPSFSVQQNWHRLYHHEPRSLWLRGRIAKLFNDATDEWVEVEAELYGRRCDRGPW